MAALALRTAFALACLSHEASAFTAPPPSTLRPPASPPTRCRARSRDVAEDDRDPAPHRRPPHARTRRSTLIAAAGGAAAAAAAVPRAEALGALPEFSDATAILQSLTIDVTDKSQYEETIAFFTKGFDGMKVLRERKGGAKDAVGAVKDTWLGFGPETLSVPPGFELPVSALSQYGGHAALHVRYDPLATAPLYVPSYSDGVNVAPAPGDNVAYLQLGVTSYKISQMQNNGGNILDAFATVDVVSPAGLPVRGIVGIRADPMMFVALNCNDVRKSEEFYVKLGFARQAYPYARLNEGKGQFEPPQPPDSVYLAPSINSMGVLLLQNPRRKRNGAPNPVLRSLNVVYAPSEQGAEGAGGSGEAEGVPSQPLIDPTSVPISFLEQESFEQEIKKTVVRGP